MQGGKIQDDKEVVAAVELSRSAGNRVKQEVSAAIEKAPESLVRGVMVKTESPSAAVEVKQPAPAQQEAVLVSDERRPSPEVANTAVTTSLESAVPADRPGDTQETENNQPALVSELIESVDDPGTILPDSVISYGTDDMPDQKETAEENTDLESAAVYGQTASSVDTLSPDDLLQGRARPPGEVLRQSELILASYLSAYERGNLEQLLSLFHPDVVTDDGAGIGIIEKDYDRLFRNTLERRLVVQRSEWLELDPEKVKLVSEVEVHVLAGRFDGWQYFSGVMSFHFQKRDGLTQISELRFELEQR